MASFTDTIRLVNVNNPGPGVHYLHVALDWYSAGQQSSIAESNEYDNFAGGNVAVP